MEENYFDENEKQDFKLMKQMNEDHGWFKDLVDLRRGTSGDVSGHTQDGEKVAIELKYRYKFNYPTVYIEETKLNWMKSRKEEGFKTIYINFINGEMWAVNPLKGEWPKSRVFINNKGKGIHEWVWRYEIPNEEFKKWKVNPDYLPKEPKF